MFSLPQFLRKTLLHHWRVNLSVALACAVAVAVLTGSLLVGSSVRSSLRALTLQRLGPVDHALVSEQFFQAKLADKLNESSSDDAPAASGVILMSASVLHAETEARAGQASVMGVNRDFWNLAQAGGQNLPAPLAGNAFGLEGFGEYDAALNEDLAREIQAKVDDEILLRVQLPSAVGRETFIGQRDETVATLRLRVAKILTSEQAMSGFGLQPSQRQILNIFVPLQTLQKSIDREDRINAILANDTLPMPQELLRSTFVLQDLGINLPYKTVPPAKSPEGALPGPSHSYLSLESARIFLTPHVAEVALQCASDLGYEAAPTLAYLANEIRVGERTEPYSIVAGLDQIGDGNQGPEKGEIFFCRFAADDLQARVGDPVGLTYFVPGPMGELAEKTTTLTLSKIVPMASPWIDEGLTPDFPGLKEADDLGEWDPPFPFEESRIRSIDEDYWDLHHAAPKAFVALGTARELWGNPYGDLTSIRFPSPSFAATISPDEAERKETLERDLRSRLDLALAGLAFMPVKELGLAASKGASDFGGLFIGFSLFILISAAMLIQILFRLGVEGRAREIGLLGAVGFPAKHTRRLLLAEGGLLAAAGGIAGLLLAAAYGKLMVLGLNTWWVGSIGSPFVRLSLSPVALAGGFFGGWVVALFSITFTVRRVSRLPARRLLSGRVDDEPTAAAARSKSGRIGSICTALGLVLLFIALTQSAQAQAMLFFAIGALLMIGTLSFFSYFLGRSGATAIQNFSLTRLGMGASKRRPGRSLLVAALMASATFLIVAVGANRQVAGPMEGKESGTGGFSLLAQSALPVYRPLKPEILSLDKDAPPVTIHSMRLRDGDDASCRNLYQASEPRILGLGNDFLERGGFVFSASEAHDAETKANPWLLLRQALPDGATPVIGDYTTVKWLLHLGLGKELTLGGHRLRVVGLLYKSVYQSELLMSVENFQRLFPDQSGYRVFAIETPPETAPKVAAALETALDEYGMDATSAPERLNSLMTIENTYLATFQSLGGLGLLLGTLGLALALLRNLIERRREFALLRSLGFRFRALLWLAVSENLLLLIIGMASGTFCALTAIAPALLSRAAQPDWAGLIATLAAIFCFGLIATILSAALALRAPLLEALREE